MVSRRLPATSDRIVPGAEDTLRIDLDGTPVDGLRGQTIAGVLLGSGVLAWRRTSGSGNPRGVFCGIGVCFDCIVTVNGQRDVRACQRRATDGDRIETQHDALPEPTADHDPNRDRA
ncbi:MAG TPA: (2Fe-2S)-binding protein [Plantibacter sp.]|uniref:(2Fe-2S)-binding protein n=1 Tax=unclassified Plantibacter TaxID=2624265 RepID=UPI002C3D2D5C|nr:(2Fe-2S)-binding protein [Plantibacter sp.]